MPSGSLFLSILVPLELGRGKVKANALNELLYQTIILRGR
jgi:hypothetical protein